MSTFNPYLRKKSNSEIKEVIMEKMKFLLGTIIPQQDQAVFAAHPANLPFLQELGFGVKKSSVFLWETPALVSI